MKLCIFGNKTTTKELLVELIHSKEKVTNIVTLSPKDAKDAKISGQDEALIEFAKSKAIEVFNPDNYSLKSNRDITFFQEQRFDIGLCTGWQRIIPKPIIDSFKHGIYGWHGSGFEFPNGRGRSPLNWSLRLGLEKIYHNLFRYAYSADDGMVFETEIIHIDKKDYISDLQKKALQHIKQSSLRLLNAINKGPLKLTEQLNHPFLSFPTLNETSGKLNPEIMGCQQALNIIRSCSRPFPGAFIVQDSKIFRIWKASSEILSTRNRKGCFILNDKLVIQFKDGQILSEDFEISKS